MEMASKGKWGIAAALVLLVLTAGAIGGIYLPQEIAGQRTESVYLGARWVDDLRWDRPATGIRDSEGIGELVATTRVCQTFVARYNGLSRVRVALDDLGRKNSGPFHFYLRASPDAAENLVQTTHDASEVRSGVDHVFDFPPIADSGGQSYAFCLEAPEAELDNSITAIGVRKDWYPQGQALFRDMWGEAAGVQDLDFQLGYQLPLWDKLATLLARHLADKPLLLGSRWFYALLATAYVVLLYTLFARLLGVAPRRS